MALASKPASIVLSTLIAAVLIIGAFILSSHNGPSRVGAEGSEELLRAYAAKDSDGDGLHDWLEELYGSDPANPHSLDPSLTDRQAVDAGKTAPKLSSEEELVSAEELLEVLPGSDPAKGSLTEAFAREFFEGYLTGEGTGRVPTDNDLVSFVERKIREAVDEHEPIGAFTKSSLQTVPTSEASLRAYAASVETVLRSHTIYLEKSEIEYFADVVYTGKPAGLAKVKEAAAFYASLASSLAKVSVPEGAADAHLAAVNAMVKIGQSLSDMAAYESDPLLGFIGASTYEPSLTELAAAFSALYGVFMQHSVSLLQGEAGFLFYETVQTAYEFLNEDS